MTKQQEGINVIIERFGKDSLLSIATIDGDRPSIRIVNAYYQDGAFYTITYALSNKVKQIGKNPNVAISGEWFTANGIGENLGWIRDEKNAVLAAKLRAVFAAWLGNGHVNESDENTIILRVKLTDASVYGKDDDSYYGITEF